MARLEEFPRGLTQLMNPRLFTDTGTPAAGLAEAGANLMTEHLREFALILLTFQVKHLLADFFFQSDWTVIGKERSSSWLAPLLAHSGGHAALTTCIVLLANPAFWWLGPADLFLHAAIDRGKAVAGRALAAGEGSRVWWRLFGIDQMLHNVTHLGYALILAFSLGVS